jgi:hypothetical protein
MRIAKNIFLIFGIAFILINTLAYLGGHAPFLKNRSPATQIGYFIGSNFFFIMGVVFFLISNRYKKKIKNNKDNELVDSLLNNS